MISTCLALLHVLGVLNTSSAVTYEELIDSFASEVQKRLDATVVAKDQLSPRYIPYHPVYGNERYLCTQQVPILEQNKPYVFKLTYRDLEFKPWVQATETNKLTWSEVEYETNYDFESEWSRSPDSDNTFTSLVSFKYEVGVEGVSTTVVERLFVRDIEVDDITNPVTLTNKTKTGLNFPAFDLTTSKALEVVQSFLDPDYDDWLALGPVYHVWDSDLGSWIEEGNIVIDDISHLNARVWDCFKKAGQVADKHSYFTLNTSNTQILPGWRVNQMDQRYVTVDSLPEVFIRYRAYWDDGYYSTNTVMYSMSPVEEVLTNEVPDAYVAETELCVIGPGEYTGSPVSWISPSKIVATNGSVIKFTFGTVGGEYGEAVKLSASGGAVLSIEESTVTRGPVVVSGTVVANGQTITITASRSGGSSSASLTILEPPEGYETTPDLWRWFSVITDPADFFTRIPEVISNGYDAVTGSNVVTITHPYTKATATVSGSSPRSGFEVAGYRYNYWPRTQLDYEVEKVRGNIPETEAPEAYPASWYYNFYTETNRPTSYDIDLKFQAGITNWVGVYKFSLETGDVQVRTHYLNTSNSVARRSVQFIPQEHIRWSEPDNMPELQIRLSNHIDVPDDLDITFSGKITGLGFFIPPERAGHPAYYVVTSDYEVTVSGGDITLDMDDLTRTDEITGADVKGYWAVVSRVDVTEQTKPAYGYQLESDMVAIAPTSFPRNVLIEFGYFKPDFKRYILAYEGLDLDYQLPDGSLVYEEDAWTRDTELGARLYSLYRSTRGFSPYSYAYYPRNVIPRSTIDLGDTYYQATWANTRYGEPEVKALHANHFPGITITPDTIQDRLDVLNTVSKRKIRGAYRGTETDESETVTNGSYNRNYESEEKERWYGGEYDGCLIDTRREQTYSEIKSGVCITVDDAVYYNQHKPDCGAPLWNPWDRVYDDVDGETYCGDNPAPTTEAIGNSCWVDTQNSVYYGNYFEARNVDSDPYMFRDWEDASPGWRLSIHDGIKYIATAKDVTNCVITREDHFITTTYSHSVSGVSRTESRSQSSKHYNSFSPAEYLYPLSSHTVYTKDNGYGGSGSSTRAKMTPTTLTRRHTYYKFTEETNTFMSTCPPNTQNYYYSRVISQADPATTITNIFSTTLNPLWEIPFYQPVGFLPVPDMVGKARDLAPHEYVTDSTEVSDNTDWDYSASGGSHFYERLTWQLEYIHDRKSLGSYELVNTYSGGLVGLSLGLNRQHVAVGSYNF